MKLYRYCQNSIEIPMYLGLHIYFETIIFKISAPTKRLSINKLNSKCLSVQEKDSFNIKCAVFVPLYFMIVAST